jgi:hypothetical protein
VIKAVYAVQLALLVIWNSFSPPIMVSSSGSDAERLGRRAESQLLTQIVFLIVQGFSQDRIWTEL